ncbi:MAG: TraR/DksA C4-type zinc finger protein [Patescibacteria group bacterium]|nr:TraR/DksA C4-type zinc finger protein [Patescibacteria group bacterium]
MKKNKNLNINFKDNFLIKVKSFLTKRLSQLQKTKVNVSSSDPFLDNSRLSDNASIDTDAAEQYGHIITSSLKSEVDKRIIQVKKALSMIKVGKYGICEDCGKMIDTGRLMVEPEATMCAKCAQKRE